MKNCFACGKRLSPNRLQLVDTGEDQAVAVGPECFKRIKAAGTEGLSVPGFSGRLYVITPARLAYFQSKRLL